MATELGIPLLQDLDKGRVCIFSLSLSLSDVSSSLRRHAADYSAQVRRRKAATPEDADVQEHTRVQQGAHEGAARRSGDHAKQHRVHGNLLAPLHVPCSRLPANHIFPVVTNWCRDL